jgi:hypothetical protein
MLTDDERKQLELIDALTYSMTSHSMRLVEFAEGTQDGYFVPSSERLWPQAFRQRMCTSIIGD